VANIPVFEPYLVGNEVSHVTRALTERHLSGTSPIIDEFEKGFARFCGSSHAVAVANGTVALHLATLALGLKPGDEVILPDFTIISDVLAITLTGATPVFVDVSPTDWCIDIEKVKAAITPKTVGIIAVHMYGQACDMDALGVLAREKKLWIIEDAAQGQGGFWKDQPLGSIGDIGTFSFYANKLITTGEGGAVISRQKDLIDEMKLQRNLGFDPEPSRRFIHTRLSNNYRMSGLQAALGLGQLEKVDLLIAERERVRTQYREAFGNCEGFTLPIADPRCRAAFWMCAVCLDDEARISIEELQGALRKEGIDSRRFFYPLHRQPALAGLHQQKDQAFPTSDRLFERGLYLPSSSLLTWEQIKLITATFQGLLRT
jgi:perosamine synthetase